MPLISSKRNSRIKVKRPRIAQVCAIFLLSGTAVTGPVSAPAFAEAPTIQMDPMRDPHAAAIAEASVRFAIPEHWIRAVMQAESAGDPRAAAMPGPWG